MYEDLAHDDSYESEGEILSSSTTINREEFIEAGYSKRAWPVLLGDELEVFWQVSSSPADEPYQTRPARKFVTWNDPEMESIWSDLMKTDIRNPSPELEAYARKAMEIESAWLVKRQ
jgi:hypothetical protein